MLTATHAMFVYFIYPSYGEPVTGVVSTLNVLTQSVLRLSISLTSGVFKEIIYRWYV